MMVEPDNKDAGFAVIAACRSLSMQAAVHSQEFDNAAAACNRLWLHRPRTYGVREPDRGVRPGQAAVLCTRRDGCRVVGAGAGHCAAGRAISTEGTGGEACMTPATIDFTAGVSPEERAIIEAQSDAMVQRAEVYERQLIDRIAEFTHLRGTTDGAEMLTCIANVIALEQLRCAALGCAEPSWQEALERQNLLARTTIAVITPIFRQEAMDD